MAALCGRETWLADCGGSSTGSSESAPKKFAGAGTVFFSGFTSKKPW
jgi:hypothetical protein